MRTYQALVGVFGFLVSLSPCPGAQEPDRAVPITTELINAAGQIVGHATLTHQEAGVQVFVQVQRLPPGTYPMHFHAVGKWVVVSM